MYQFTAEGVALQERVREYMAISSSHPVSSTSRNGKEW